MNCKQVIGNLLFGAACGILIVFAIAGAIFLALVPHWRLVP